MELTIEQERAKFALDYIQKLPNTLTLKEQTEFISTEFISHASGLPAMIHMNGLGQAMAFCRLKSEKSLSYKVLYQLVSEWLCQSKQPYANKIDVLAGVVECDRHHYQLAQAETLALMSWVKKFAKAFLSDEQDEGNH